MAAPPASPSTDNYSIGKGGVKFTPDGGAERSLGNCPSFKLTPALTKLDHFSSQVGTRVKDKSVVTEKAVTLDMTLDEITDLNLALVFMGTSVAGVFQLLSLAAIEGVVEFTGTNEVGSLVHWIGNVSFIPKEGFDLISDGWEVITIQGEVLADSNGEFGQMTVTAQA